MSARDNTYASSQGDDPDEAYDDYLDGITCPHCSGSGEVPCHCGGDLCVCDNHGDAPCYVCGGEGEVSEARYEQYEENQRRNYEAMRKIMGDR